MEADLVVPPKAAALLAASLGLGLAACASYTGIVPGVSTEADVRSLSGRPTDVRFSRDGSEIWEYATGPQGTETYVVAFDGNGVVRSASQVLTEGNVDRVVPGRTTKAEVRDILGRPGDVYDMNGRETWEWRFVPLGFAPQVLAISFAKDGVVEKVVKVDETTGGGRRGRR